MCEATPALPLALAEDHYEACSPATADQPRRGIAVDGRYA